MSKKQLSALRIRLARAARDAGKPQYIIEKDYALSYVLAGIYDVPLLREAMVFKGDTCLRKVYFRDYRFSEDLDFTLRRPLDPSVVVFALQEAGKRTEVRLLEYGGFEVTVEQKNHRDAHPGAQVDCRIKVQFPWMRATQCSLKVEVTADEPVLMDPIERRVIHPYLEEDLQIAVMAYRLEEVMAEKLRALLQKREQWHARGWTSNRPRDLYDLWHLHRQTVHAIDWDAVSCLLPDKADARGVAYSNWDDFLDADVLSGIERDWEKHLNNFVPFLPPFGECLESLQTLLGRIIS